MIQNSKRRYRKIKYFTNRTKLNFSVTAGALAGIVLCAVQRQSPSATTERNTSILETLVLQASPTTSSSRFSQAS
jgi:hypothetical protein